MRIQILLLATLMLATPAYSVEIDITDDPNREFFIGYNQSYPNKGCNVIWFASKWGRDYLMSVGECEGISNDRAYKDAVSAMDTIKAKSDAANFAEYEREIKKSDTKPAAVAPSKDLRCLDTHSGTYIFLPAEAHNRPGWYYLDKIHNGGRLRTSVVGYWKETSSGLVADFGINTTNVNMSNVYPC